MKALVSFLFLILLATAASAQNWSVGEVQGDTDYRTTVKAATQVDKTWAFKLPSQIKEIEDLNDTELEVISVQISRTGNQRDFIPVGMASRFLFRDTYGVMRIHKAAAKAKACDNKVIRLWLPHWEKRVTVCSEGLEGPRGPQGYPGPQGPQGPQGAPGEVRFVIAPHQADWSLHPTRTPYYEPGWFHVGVGVGWELNPARTNISTSSTGGEGGSTGLIKVDNRNVNDNVNVNPNNNVISIGPGSAGGTATGTGTGSAKSGHQ